MKWRFKKKMGFTLIELMTVIAVMLIMSGILFVNHREGAKQLALDRSIHKLAQDIRLIQDMAMSSKRHSESSPQPAAKAWYGHTLYHT